MNSNPDKGRKAREIAFYAIFASGVTGGDPVAELESIFGGHLPEDHPFRELLELLDIKDLAKVVNLKERPIFQEHSHGYQEALRTVLLVFWKDLSPRQLRIALADRLEMRWFSGYNITALLPGQDYFSRLYREIGTRALARLFQAVGRQVAKSPFEGNWSAFTSASGVEESLTAWEKRDEGRDALEYMGLVGSIYKRVALWKKHRDEIDDMINARLNRGRISDIAGVARAAIRLGIIEMDYMKDIPGPVAINEAIEITKTFGDRSLAGFVNGILGSRYETMKNKGDMDEQQKGAVKT